MAANNTSLDLDPAPWCAVNDGVMGGVSAGEIVANEDGGLRFQGTLSLANNGGFASVRRPLEQNLKNAKGIRLSIKGDGRRYQFRTRTNINYDGIAWRHEFVTDNSWQTLELLFNDFEPVFRGRTVSSAQPLNRAGIRQIGFLIADGRPGAFSLNIASIEYL